MKNYVLIVTEKPDAAARIATALDSTGSPKRFLDNGVPYFTAITDREIVVVPALGHLFTVAAEKKGMEYPVFDYKWVPLHVAERSAKRAKAWLETIAKLAKSADSFVDACDFDIEGSIIGYMILKFACGGADERAKRMKYSTLTKSEIEKSYAGALQHLDLNLIEAGLARHEVDWLYGMNLSRALMTAATKTSGQYVTLSTGRVQGPTLNFLASRERSIRKFVPTPFWSIDAMVVTGDGLLEADYEKAAIESREEADQVMKACTGKKGKIEKIEKEKFQQSSPIPFDLGLLQNEAFRLFKYTPMRTSKIAQRLYLDALISYPRTNSQKLPIAIGYVAIMKKLAEIPVFAKYAMELLAKPILKPREGKGFDPAHPAIYPTGDFPKRILDRSERNIWSLIVKRFLATFGEPALKQSTRIIFDVNGSKFVYRGEETLNEGWRRFYKPYMQSENLILPRISEGQEVTIEELHLKSEFTRPPARYNPASLLRRMQKEEIGTKATRAGIIQTLYDRKYIQGERISVTDIGYEVISVLKDHCPTIVSSELTRKLEKEMEEIRQGKETKQVVIQATIKILKPAIEELKSQENKIGARLSQAVKKAKLEERAIGNCPSCQNGKLLILRSSKTRKRFIGCTGYFEGNCKTSFPLPQRGSAKPKGICRTCGWPTLRILVKQTRSWTLCFNPQCPSKEGNTQSA